MGSDRDAARASVRGIAAGGLTALYEAVLVALRSPATPCAAPSISTGVS